MKLASVILIFSGIFGMLSFQMKEEVNSLNDSMRVADLLIALGEEPQSHYIAEPDPHKVRLGKEMLENGRTRLPGGRMSSYISKFYVCTDCHNQVREDPVLNESNPEERLSFAIKNDLKFLQATTFWGMVDRESWYNGDYEEKYGALVEKARHDLGESTQLCAKECSSGRHLSEWELEAFMHYYNTIGLTVGDLPLSKEQKITINKALTKPGAEQEAIRTLKSTYSLASPATFGHPPENLEKGFENLEGNAQNGESIYERSCQTCHREYGPSQLILDDGRDTFKKLRRHLDRHTDFNIYQITRKGTYAQPGHRQYMPMYTTQRLSDQQLEDLRVFIANRASGEVQ